MAGKSETRAAVYVRISSDPSGKAAGVRRQEDECKALAKSKVWDVVEVFTDNDVKATGLKRPGFDRLMKAIDAGEVDAVVAWKDDRLLRGGRSRWAHEFLSVIKEHQTSIAFVNGESWDFSTASGRMLVEVRLAVAGYEVEVASERQEARWRQRKKDGKLANLGRRPFGLKRQGETMVEVKREADAIRQAAKDIISGASLYSVTRQLPKPPYAETWKDQHVRRMLTSDHLVTYGVLDEDTHRLVAARLNGAKRESRGRPAREYPLSGLVVCSTCSSKMSAGNGQYRCDAGHQSIQTKYLDPLVADEVPDHVPDEDDGRKARKRSGDEAKTLKDLAKVEAQMEELADDIELPVAVLKRRTAALEAKRVELLGRLGRDTESRIDFEYLKRWAMGEIPGDQKVKDFLRTVIEQVTISPATQSSRKGFDPRRVEVTWK